MQEDPIYTQLYHRWSMKYRRMIDRYIMYKNGRWFLTLLLFVIFGVRIYITKAFFVVTYVALLFTLQQFVRYLTPLGLPDIDDEDDDMDLDIQLPSQLGASNDRPLLRSVSEIQLWEQVSIAMFLAILATFSIIFDLPVYWPFLLSYFIMLILMTFKKYLKHMQKYGYRMSDFGKSRNRGYQR